MFSFSPGALSRRLRLGPSRPRLDHRRFAQQIFGRMPAVNTWLGMSLLTIMRADTGLPAPHDLDIAAEHRRNTKNAS